MRRQWGQRVGVTLAALAAAGIVGVAPSPLVHAARASTVAMWSNYLGAGPPARTDPLMAYDAASGQTVMFGGVTISGGVGVGAPTDTWTWNGQSWTQQLPATTPGVHFLGAMAYDPAQQQVVLFGGTGDTTGLVSSTWGWNGTNWTELATTGPSARLGASMTYDSAHGVLVLFGGWANNQLLSDTWTWNGTVWTQQHPATSPPPREMAALAYDAGSKRVVLFGGQNAGGLGDTWLWDGTTWTHAAPPSSPPGRSSTAMVYDENQRQLVLFGGVGNLEYNDTWTWNGTTWTQQHPPQSPPAFQDMGAAYDPVHDEMLVYGGYVNNAALGATWIYTGGGPPATVPVRVAGSDRVATAVAASNASYPNTHSAAVAVIARDDDYADALAGVPLAVAKNGPLLLTEPSALDPRVAAEIQRVSPTGVTVYLLGGPGALGPSIDAAVRGMGDTPVRLAGTDRFDTAARIASEGLGGPADVFLATGTSFADALAAGPAAAKAQGAVVLTDGSTMPAATAAYFNAHPPGRLFAIGGPAAAAAPSATPIVGATRYATAAQVASNFFPNPTAVGLASGTVFADALSGAPHIARLGGPLLLADPTTTAVDSATAAYLTTAAPTTTSAYVYGGATAVPDPLLAALQMALG